MLLLFKIIGLICIFSSCSALGFLKSTLLKKRKEKLSSISRSVSRLAEYIRGNGGEINLLAGRCFSPKDITVKNGVLILDESFLEKEDISLIKEFLSDFGLKDSEGEYQRTKLYAELIESQRKISAEKFARLSRLYNTVGVLFGMVVCIFFI